MYKAHLLILCFLNFLVSYQTEGQTLKSFPLSDVSLLESPFYNAQQTDKEYILALDPDRLLAPFMLDAGLKPNADRYGNWENSGLDGHIGGHYLSALSFMYASTGEKELQERLNYTVDVLARCQEKNGNGYVGGIPGGQEMWKNLSQGNIDAGKFSLNGKWVPLYNIHKLFAGLRDAWEVAGNEKAKQVLIRLSDWLIQITSNLTDAQLQQMLISEHGGLNEVPADVYAITKKEKYLKLAVRLTHQKFLEPLLANRDELTGMHANTQIPKVIGVQRIAELKGDSAWNKAAKFFWETVVNHRTVSIGGNSVREHFNPVDDFSSMIESNEGPETCNTYNMLRLSQMLFLQNPSGKYIDYYERALYNHILSSQHLDGGFVYFTPMRPQHYRVYSQPQESFWCCVGSGLENHGKYGEMVYAHTDEDIYVNLFIPSRLSWKEKNIKLIQTTDFPFENATRIEVGVDKPSRFKILIRHPEWAISERFEIFVNGQRYKFSSQPSSYVSIDKRWKDGDIIDVKLPMHTQAEYLPGDSSWVSLVHGPIVLAAVTDSANLDGLWADDTRMGHVAKGDFYPIESAPVFVGGSDFYKNVDPSPDSTMIFTAQDVIGQEKFKSLKLIPFFTIHEARYQIYWPLLKADELDVKMQEYRERETYERKLGSITVDKIATGEQQPEAEHDFTGVATNSGISNGRFWRDASGWFSYTISNKDLKGRILRITYFGGDAGRNFKILIDEKLLAHVNLAKGKGDTFYDVDYIIPEEILNTFSKENFNLKFVAGEGSVAGGVYYIRLLEKSEKDIAE